MGNRRAKVRLMIVKLNVEHAPALALLLQQLQQQLLLLLLLLLLVAVVVVCSALALRRHGGIKAIVTVNERLRHVPETIQRHLDVQATR